MRRPPTSVHLISSALFIAALAPASRSQVPPAPGNGPCEGIFTYQITGC